MTDSQTFQSPKIQPLGNDRVLSKWPLPRPQTSLGVAMRPINTTNVSICCAALESNGTLVELRPRFIKECGGGIIG